MARHGLRQVVVQSQRSTEPPVAANEGAVATDDIQSLRDQQKRLEDIIRDLQVQLQGYGAPLNE